MTRILSILNKEGIRCLPCERLSLDADRFSEYKDSDEHPAEEPFERPTLHSGRKRVIEIDKRLKTILKYFLDGSRRTYKVADLIVEGRYLPLVAGQTGVAVVRRSDEGHCVQPLREFCQFHNVIAFPDCVAQDDLNHLRSRINRPGLPEFRLLSYEVKKGRDPVDLAVARIMRHMQDLEVQAVAALSSRGLLQNDSMLVVDGPLRFKEMKARPFDIVQFRNVLGLSKAFRPSFTVGKGRRREDVGAITSQLAFAERSCVFRTYEEDKSIGMWYLRLRPPSMMLNPLQGIVKMECYAIDEEDKESGLDGERVDIISAHILAERNVSPYHSDWRWASHIYPIYLAETYLKASFMGDTCFMALF